jgi:hypothetical protein
MADCSAASDEPLFPFDPDEIVGNLLLERAFTRDGHSLVRSLVRSSYYRVRPVLYEAIRKRLQRGYMTWKHDLSFPKWPVDTSVERILEIVLAKVMRAHGLTSVPFIWFWPDGYSCALSLTHDVEEVGGRDFCGALMDLDENAGFRSSFQLIPEKRYSIPDRLLTSMRDRGFEINVHDLNHDGMLFASHKGFIERSEAINQYGRLMMAKGFRSGAMYRDLRWYGALEFEYDMSVPNSGRWEAQGGGCCTVMPYFVDFILELPLTTVQDYVLFELWKEYSIEIWKEQARLIREKHGLITFLIHPDYVIDMRARQAYVQLLEYLNHFRSEGDVWCALPGEVNDWWRQRASMLLVEDGNGTWRIEGTGSDRARIAVAQLSGDRIAYRIGRTGEGMRSG